MYKEFVDQIHQEKAKNDSNSRDLARTLNVLSKTVFGEVNRFVFELLQNADDSSTDGNPISVKFHLLDNYLVFSHNGKHFTKEDVQGISGIGNKASQKDKNNEKTGYKGIGFKSVFGSSNYAHILSGDFSFRFDKDYVGFGNSDDYPWQVVPIWTTDVAEEVNGSYDKDKVNTIIHIENRIVIKEEIIKVFEDCQIILFLRNVKTVTFLDKNSKVFEISKDVKDQVVDLYNNKRLESSWIIKNMQLAIDDALSSQLNQLSDTECPQKLKEAKATKLTFAAQVADRNLIALKRTVVYSYLPTKAQKGFPFLINGDFLTNAERTELMPNIWNEFLFKEIALQQLKWFKELQDTDYRFGVLNLLKGKYPNYTTSKIELAYNKSLEEAIAIVDFLPQQKNDKYTVTITNSIVDGPQFSEYFPPSVITNYFGVAQTHSIVDVRLENQSALTTLGATHFTFTHLLKLILSGTLTSPTDAVNLVVFFYNRTINNKNPSWLSQLGTAAFILDEERHYKTPKEIFIPAQNGNFVTGFGNLSYVHSDILSHFNKSPEVTGWLQNLGVREPTDHEVVRKAIIPIILNDGVNEQNALCISHFLFKVYKTKVLSDQEYEDLRLLKVLTTNGLKKTSQSYLSDRYVPEKKLSAILPKASFLSEDYIEHQEDIVEWKGFFKKIGVRENISIDLIEDKVDRQAFEGLHPESKQYFSWLESTIAFPAIYHSYRYSGQHYIQNFTSIEFRSHLNTVEFSKFFWGKMLDGWDIFMDKCSTTYYYYRGGSSIVPSYVQYYVKNFECIPCTNGKCYKGTDIFSPSLKSIIGNIFPVADLPSSITVGQADFFGFKKTITVPECLDLLDKICLQAPSSDLNKQVFAIYDQLIGQSLSNDPATKTKILSWRETGKLLTINNTFQAVKNLYTFSVQGTATPVNSERFIKLPNGKSFDEINALSHFLSIPVITFDKLKFVAEGTREEKALWQALIKRARFLALIHAHNSSENYTQVASRLSATLYSTSFLQAEKLNLIYQLDNGDLIVDSKIDAWNGKPSEFYYTGKWNSPLTLYGLSNSICTLLGLKDMEREFALILQLEHDDIYLWLKEKGYKVDELGEEELFNYDTSEPFDGISQPEESPYTGIDIEFFVEEIKVDEIDFTNVVVPVREFSGTFLPMAKEYVEIESQQVKVDIGRWSEEYVFKYFQQNSQVFTSINWLNEEEESYMPYDFEVIENGIKKYIEVKGTPSLTKEVIYLSEAEWKVLFNQGSNYSIFRVFGAGTINNRLERTDNLKDLISDGKMLSFPIQLIIA